GGVLAGGQTGLDPVVAGGDVHPLAAAGTPGPGAQGETVAGERQVNLAGAETDAHRDLLGDEDTVRPGGDLVGKEGEQVRGEPPPVDLDDITLVVVDRGRVVDTAHHRDGAGSLVTVNHVQDLGTDTQVVTDLQAGDRVGELQGRVAGRGRLGEHVETLALGPPQHPAGTGNDLTGGGHEW